MRPFFESGVGRDRQRGDVLLEALIGVLITALVGAGMAHVASRIAVSQRDAKIESLAVERMRDLLQSRGVALCTLPEAHRQFSLPGRDAVMVQVECVEATAPLALRIGEAVGEPSTVPAERIPQEVILSIAAADLELADGEGQPALVVGTRQLPEVES